MIAKRATGRYHWEKSFTPQQRQEFTDLFAEFLGNNYLTRINGTVKGLKVEYVDEMLDESGKRAKVRTKLPASNSDVAVDYSMRLRDGKWKIYDVYVEGVSLVPLLKDPNASLDRDALVKILTEPKNALVKQYQKLFEFENVKLKFTEGALRAVARKAMERKSGARGLRATWLAFLPGRPHDAAY